MRVFLSLLLLEAFINVVFEGQINREIFALIYILINSLAIMGWFYIKSKNKTIGKHSYNDGKNKTSIIG